MEKINLKEVARKIVEKQTYRIIKDKRTGQVATELSDSVDVASFSSFGRHIGDDFRNMPFSLDKGKYGYIKYHVELVGIEGDIIETINCSKYDSIDNSDAFNEERRNFKFASSKDTMVFALKLIEDARGNCRAYENYLLFLSKPMTIGEIQAKRDSYYESQTNSRIEKSLEAIEFIWK